MQDKSKIVNVTMIRENLDHIPRFPLRRPYKYRWYRPGDAQHWYRIWSTADAGRGVATPETFARDFGSDDDALAKRQVYVCDATGNPVATATAWFRNDYYGHDYGLVHWVAVAPEAQGRGLSKPLVATVLKRMVKLGHERAMLVTQPYRTRAIKVYLDLGFLPDLKPDDAPHLWREVRDAMPGSLLDGLDLGGREAFPSPPPGAPPPQRD